MKKLVVRLKGGLGNQLFCYAAARRLAHINGAELVLDVVSGFKYDYEYKRSFALAPFSISARHAHWVERMEPLGRLRRYLARQKSVRLPLQERRYIQQVGVQFEPELLELRLQEGLTYFDGFGQSEKYFQDVEQIIRSDLVMVSPSESTVHRTSKIISESPTIALHVRWFDKVPTAQWLDRARAYYILAVAKMRSCEPMGKFLVFSDRIDQTRELLDSCLGQECRNDFSYQSEPVSPSADMWLMRQCKHFILSDSTFAWWAAWLAEDRKGATQVIAPGWTVNPEYSKTAWGFPGLLPQRWTVIS
jgi:hypothetical protein